MNRRQIKKADDKVDCGIGRDRKEYYRNMQSELSNLHVWDNGYYDYKWDLIMSRAVMHKGRRKYQYKRYYMKMLKMFQVLFPNTKPSWDMR